MSGSRRRRRGRHAGSVGGPNGGGPRRLPGSRRNGSAPGRGRRVPELCELAPFSVFCALHLGITEDDGYARPDASRVARRFGLTSEELESYLQEHALTQEALRAADFDCESAQLDIEVAPEGISRVELARTMFADLRGHRDA